VEYLVRERHGVGVAVSGQVTDGVEWHGRKLKIKN
jgi:hypothetical protein